MSSNLPLVCWSRRGRGGRKLEINIPQQQIHENSKGGLINEGGVISSEYGTHTQTIQVINAQVWNKWYMMVSNCKL